MEKKIKVLVVEDSSLVRKVITDILSSDPDIEVVGTANNGKTAIYKNDLLNPDVITMDIEMPVMDGLESLKRIIEKNPKPVIMISVLTQHGAEETFKALEYGAVDFIPKPATNLPITLKELSGVLIEKVKQVHHAELKIPIKKEEPETVLKKEPELVEEKGQLEVIQETSDKAVAIGTSTGGPSALVSIFKKIPAAFPAPVFIVQHMPAGFTKAFAERLNNNSGLNVKEAEDGDKIYPGCGYLAPGDAHIKIAEENGEKVIRLVRGDKVSGHIPSIDVMFDSVADNYGKDSVCVIMTGMGQDGAKGIKKVKDLGGYTFAQDEETSVVFGMNRVAIQNGAINEVVSLYDIANSIISKL
ncbi:MAG: chemotaxis response regulator protein-glutamate methylesterase [Spirochaetes bacterium]|nr:chemotaxis response regulator protein-glutamate methylesterase [Spirochaetota bacterium]